MPVWKKLKEPLRRNKKKSTSTPNFLNNTEKKETNSTKNKNTQRPLKNTKKLSEEIPKIPKSTIIFPLDSSN